MTDTQAPQVQQGDQVSWKWSGSRPSGEVAEVKEQGEVSIESHRGNTIKKSAGPGDPAVHIARSGNDVVKNASDLNVEEKANGAATNGESKKEHAKPSEPVKKDAEIKGAHAAEERPTEKQIGVSEPVEQPEVEQPKEETKEVPKEAASEEKKAETPKPQEKAAEVPKTRTKRKAEDSSAAEKQAKTDEDEPAAKKQKKPGRPKSTEKEPAKKRAPKKAATADGQPRRSGRNKS